MMSARGLGQTALVANPESVAIRTLGFLCERRAMFDRFLESSGLSSFAFVRQPFSSELARKALDFLVADEAALMQFVERTDIPVEAAYEARRSYYAAHAAAHADQPAPVTPS